MSKYKYQVENKRAEECRNAHVMFIPHLYSGHRCKRTNHKRRLIGSWWLILNLELGQTYRTCTLLVWYFYAKSRIAWLRYICQQISFVYYARFYSYLCNRYLILSVHENWPFAAILWITNALIQAAFYTECGLLSFFTQARVRTTVYTTVCKRLHSKIYTLNLQCR